jgi:flagellar biogenesis protein FliO
MKTILIALLFCSFRMLALANADSSSTPDTQTDQPSLHQAPSYEGTLIKMVLTLAGLVTLVFLTIWVLKKVSHGRFGNFGSQKKISIVEKKPLSPKTLLYLIEVDGKKVLLSESQLEVRMHSLSQEQELYE